MNRTKKQENAWNKRCQKCGWWWKETKRTKTYLKDTHDLKKSGTRKIELTIAINFVSLKSNAEECVMHSKLLTNYITNAIR